MRVWMTILLVTVSLFSGATVSAQSPEEDAEMALLEDYPAVQYWVNLWNGRADNQQNVAEEYLTTAYVNHLQLGNVYRGVLQTRSTFFGNVTHVRTGIPDFLLDIEDVIVGEDAVVIRYTITGSSGGETFASLGFAIFHLNDDGLIEEVWNWYNQCTTPWTTCR